MPGVDLGLILPSGADSMADVVAKTAAALSAIEDDLAGKIVPAEMNINASLSMNGSYLTNAGAVQFIAGNPPTAAGSIYFSGGEFYLIDNTGLIQLTLNGALDAGGLGSIVGDYGGSNPARVTFNDASGEYRFTEDVGVWADVVADDLVLEGSAGSVRLGVDPAITTARQFIIKSLPTSGISMLVYNSATSTVEDGAATAITALSVATLTITNPLKHGDVELVLSPVPALIVPGTGAGISATNPYNPATSGSAGQTVTWALPIPLKKGDRLKSVYAAWSTATCVIHKTGVLGGDTTPAQTNSGGFITLTTPITYDNGDREAAYISATLTHPDSWGAPRFPVLVTYDHPV